MSQYYPYQVQALPYSYIALSPYCDADTLYYHHNQYYTEKVAELNRLVVEHRLVSMELKEIISRKLLLPVAQLDRLKGAAGAVYNHELYFDGIHAAPSPLPLNNIVGEIISTYGSMDRFERLLQEAARSLPGSGWVWLVFEQGTGLHIVTTQNNEVIDLGFVHPILVVDLWEHAYFLIDHFDMEGYISAWLATVDWDKADQRYLAAQSTGNESQK